jgi:hypothetical protein
MHGTACLPLRHPQYRHIPVATKAISFACPFYSVLTLTKRLSLLQSRQSVMLSQSLPADIYRERTGLNCCVIPGCGHHSLQRSVSRQSPSPVDTLATGATPPRC